MLKVMARTIFAEHALRRATVAKPPGLGAANESRAVPQISCYCRHRRQKRRLAADVVLLIRYILVERHKMRAQNFKDAQGTRARSPGSQQCQRLRPALPETICAHRLQRRGSC